MPKFYTGGILLAACICVMPIKSTATAQKILKDREAYQQYIRTTYADQLASPEVKKRKSFAQFGYGLSFFPFPLFPITGFIDPDDFGEHSYGKPSPKEKNGSLYTCKGGFIDFSHMRAAVDWTVFLSFHLICEQKDMELPVCDGTMKLHVKNLEKLSMGDIIAMSQKIAYERLVWHELCSWYYHLPNYTFNERQSTFTPEDTYSNFLGTVIGYNIVKRILEKQEGLPFEQIASEEIKKHIATLAPVVTKKQSKEAYDIVDANIQSKLPEAERNKDVWWDSRVVFTDQRYVFKRYINIGPELKPWLVPKASQLNCGNEPKTQYVPQKTEAGISLYNYYTLTIIPDSLLFYDKKTQQQLHKPFGTFITKNIDKIITQVSAEMQKELLAGFNKRNKTNPEKKYKDLKKVWFRW